MICVDNLVTSSLRNIEHITSDDFVFLNHDVTEQLEIDEPVDFVYHFAALASPVDYLRMPLHSLKVGSYGTHHALGLAKFKRARFLLASTSEVYGDPQVHPQPETYWGHVNPIGPRGVYDEAKRYAEALTMAYHSQQGVNTAIVRIFNTYGPRMRPHDGRAIPTFVRQALANEPLTVYGDGSQTRSFCYVDDLIRGIVLLAESGEHLPVNIGNPREFTMLELAQTVLKVTGLDERDRLRGAAGRRPAGAPARHHAAPGRCSAGSRRSSSRKACGGCFRRTGGSRSVSRPPVASGGDPRGRRRARRARGDGLARTCWSGSTTRAPPSSTTRRSVFGALPRARTSGAPGQPLLGRQARRREVRGRSTARIRAMPATTGRSTTASSQYAGAYGIRRCCSRSPGRRAGRTAAPSSNRPPKNFAGPPEVRVRGRRALQRHRTSGTDGRTLPAVRLWAAWNEPNNPVFLRAAVRARPAGSG